MEVTFYIGSAAERAILMRAADEIEALYDTQAKPDAAVQFDGAKLDAQMPYVAVSDIAPIRQAVAATFIGQPVEDFVDRFRKEAQRIGAPAALNILRGQFGVNRATELSTDQQGLLLDLMATAPAVNA